MQVGIVPSKSVYCQGKFQYKSTTTVLDVDTSHLQKSISTSHCPFPFLRLSNCSSYSFHAIRSLAYCNIYLSPVLPFCGAGGSERMQTVGCVGRKESVLGLLKMPKKNSFSAAVYTISSNNSRRYCKRNTYHRRTNPTLSITRPNDPVESTLYFSLVSPLTAAYLGWQPRKQEEMGKSGEGWYYDLAILRV